MTCKDIPHQLMLLHVQYVGVHMMSFDNDVIPEREKYDNDNIEPDEDYEDDD